jgi:protein O-GlcNAc transferase
MEKTIRQSPAAAEPHSDLAFDYGALGDIDRAIEEARIAVGLEPNSMLFRLNLGNLLLQKDPNAAAREFQAVLKMHPNSSDAHYCLGLAWKAAGDAAAASAEYQRAIALQPANAEAIMALSGVYREAGRIQDAIDLCRRAAAARPRNPEPQIKLALLYMETRQYADVVKAAQEALRISPDFDRAYVAHYCLGIAYTRLNSPVAAVPELAEAIRLRPDFQQARQAYQEALAAAGSGAK